MISGPMPSPSATVIGIRVDIIPAFQIMFCCQREASDIKALRESAAIQERSLELCSLGFVLCLGRFLSEESKCKVQKIKNKAQVFS